MFILEWTIQKGETCFTKAKYLGDYKWDSQHNFNTLEAAKEECVKDESCFKISSIPCGADKFKYWEYRNTEAKNINLCRYKSSKIIHINKNGCSYKKPGTQVFEF